MEIQAYIVELGHSGSLSFLPFFLVTLAFSMSESCVRSITSTAASFSDLELELFSVSDWLSEELDLESRVTTAFLFGLDFVTFVVDFFYLDLLEAKKIED